MKQLDDIIWTLFCSDYGCVRLNSRGPKGFERNASESIRVYQCVDPRHTQEEPGNDLEDRLVFCALILRDEAYILFHGTGCVCLVLNQSK